MFGPRRILRVALVGMAVAPAWVVTAAAQDRELAFDAVVAQPRGLPQLPPEGAWGEVINVTPRWIVIQNHSGQQFPIAVEDIEEFLTRWTGNFEWLTTDSVVEAIGRDIGSNILRTNHVDVFEGEDRSLVAPTSTSILPNNMVVTTVDPGFSRFMNMYDYMGQNLLYGWAFPVNPGILGIPARLHVVGTVLQRDPLRISIPGNNIATILPDDSGRMTISQVTRGSVDHVRKGDYAFLMPRQITERGLRLTQFVLYKQIPFRQFDPNR
jgi:hypothetical protein